MQGVIIARHFGKLSFSRILGLLNFALLFDPLVSPIADGIRDRSGGYRLFFLGAALVLPTTAIFVFRPFVPTGTSVREMQNSWWSEACRVRFFKQNLRSGEGFGSRLMRRNSRRRLPFNFAAPVDSEVLLVEDQFTDMENTIARLGTCADLLNIGAQSAIRALGVQWH